MDDSDFNFSSLGDLISFQFKRRVIGAAKDYLDILELNKIYTKKLETLLTQAGITDFQDVENQHKLQRKQILDRANDSFREFDILIKKFDISIKK